MSRTLTMMQPPINLMPHLALTLFCKQCREDPPNLVEEFSSGDTVCGTCG